MTIVNKRSRLSNLSVAQDELWSRVSSRKISSLCSGVGLEEGGCVLSYQVSSHRDILKKCMQLCASQRHTCCSLEDFWTLSDQLSHAQKEGRTPSEAGICSLTSSSMLILATLWALDWMCLLHCVAWPSLWRTQLSPYLRVLFCAPLLRLNSH